MCPHQVSKAARQERRFQDYNERCTFHHQARVSRGQWVGWVVRAAGLHWEAQGELPGVQTSWAMMALAS